MGKQLPSNVQDYLEIVSWRRWWLVLPVLIISVGTFFGSLFLPRSYKSEATIIVEPQKVPANYVQPTNSVNVADRLSAIRQEILSRTRLRKIITEFNIYRTKKGAIASDGQVEMMRRDIAVELVNPPGGERNKDVAALKISFSGPEPALVQKVTRKLTSLFIEEHLKDREQQAEGTTDFLDDQLSRLRQSLQEQETRIQAFKSSHAGELPEQQVAGLQMLSQLQGLLQANSDALSRAQQQEKYLEAMLASMRLMQSPQQMKSTLQLQYEAKNAELISAEQRYRANFPDVARLRLELKALQENLEVESGKNGDDGANPAQMRVQIQGTKEEISRRMARQTQIENDMQRIQVHISNLPRVEQQFAELMRDYETSRATYQTLLTKRNSSSIAAEMERRAEGEQFRILDPPTYPEKPYKPNLLQINLLGLLAGVFVGISLTLIVEVTDQTLQRDKDIAAVVGVPMLASVPWVLSNKEHARRRVQHLILASTGGLALVLFLTATYLLRSSIMSGFGWHI